MAADQSAETLARIAAAARTTFGPWGAWSLVAYAARGELRYLWNATPLQPPHFVHLCDQGWIWSRDDDHVIVAPLYVPKSGEIILMSDGARIRTVRVDPVLANIFAERRARNEIDRIVLAPRGTGGETAP